MALTRLARVSALALALAASFELAAAPAFAQRYQDSGGTAVPGFVPIQPGVGPLFTSSNPGKISGTFSATLAGFAPGNAYATRTVGATSSNVALPTGTVVVVYNTGANAAFVALGTSNSVAATAGNDVIQPNSWMAFTVGANTWLAAIETAGATSLNISGGSGLPTGSGGGGGSSGLPIGAATSALQSAGNASAAAAAGSAATIAANTTPLAGVGTGGTGTGLTVTCTNCSGSSGSGGGSTPQTTAGGAINVSTAATTKLITGISGQYTYITAYNLIAAGTTNVSLEYGSTTTNPCDTSAVVIDGPTALTAQAGKVQGSGLGTVLPPIPQGKDVCIVNSAAIQVGGSLNYTQSTTLAGSFGGGGGGSSSPFASNGNYVNVPSITSTSANSSLPGGSGTAILMSNYGASAVMVALSASGSSAVTAATADDIIPANSTHSLAVGTSTNIAYATLSGSSSLQITGGSGQFTGAGGGGGGSSGSFTWPGSAGNGTLGVAGSGTAPYINAYLPDIASRPLTVANPAVGAFGGGGPASGAALGANGPGPFVPIIQAVADIPINISTATTTQLVALVTSKSTYVTAWDVVAGGTGNFGLEYGTQIQSFTASTATNVLTITVAPNGTDGLFPGEVITGAGITSGTTIGSLISGTPNTVGATYSLSTTPGTLTARAMTAAGANPCNVGTTALTGAYPLAAQNGIAKGIGLGTLFVLPSATTLCAVTSAAVQMSGSLSYVQF